MTDIAQAKEQAEQIKSLLHEQVKAFSNKYPELQLSVKADCVMITAHTLAGEKMLGYDVHSSFSITVS